MHKFEQYIKSLSFAHLGAIREKKAKELVRAIYRECQTHDDRFGMTIWSPFGQPDNRAEQAEALIHRAYLPFVRHPGFHADAWKVFQRELVTALELVMKDRPTENPEERADRVGQAMGLAQAMREGVLHG